MTHTDRATDAARKELILASLFLVALLVIGTLGYTAIEGWPLLDSLYMTFITLSTIGFAEVHRMGDAARMFTILIGVSGIGSVAFIAGRSAQILLNTARFHRLQMAKMIGRTSNHFILCGYGRIGARIAEDLKVNDVPFVVIETAPDKIEVLRESDCLYVSGNAEDEATLAAAGAARARGMILTLPEDSANVFVTLVARELNPDLFIVARTDKKHNRRKLLRSGVDKVISPYEIGADRMAQVILRPNVVRLIEHIGPSADLSLDLEEVEIGEGSPLDGTTLAGANFRQQFDAIVVAVIKPNGGAMEFNPSASQVLSAGDTLIVMGKGEMIAKLRNEGAATIS